MPAINPIVIDDNGCSIHFNRFTKDNERFSLSDALFSAVRELAATHDLPQHHQDAKSLMRSLRELNAGMPRNGLTDSLNDQSPNWNESVDLTSWRKAFAHSDGIHHWDQHMERHNPFLSSVESPPASGGIARGAALESIECFVVCGHAISEETCPAIRQRVSERDDEIQTIPFS